MTTFDEQLLRLKQVLGVTEDQAVAKALGMTKAAFSDRKKNKSFPEDKLYALAQQRPELRIDPGYVLMGKLRDAATKVTLAQLELAMEAVARDGMSATEQLRRAAALVEAINVPLADDEQELLTAFRALDAKSKKALIAAMREGSAAQASTKNSGSGAGMVNHGAGSVQVGRSKGKVTVKKG